MSIFGQPGGLFGNSNTNNNANTAGTTGGAAGTGAFGGGVPATGSGGSLFGSAPQTSAFGAPKPAEQSSSTTGQSTAPPAASSFFSQPPATTSGNTSNLFGQPKPPGDSAAKSSLFGNPPAAPSAPASTEAPKTSLFGGSGIFGKPVEPSTTSNPTSVGDSSAPKPSLFGGGGLFGTKPAEPSASASSTATGATTAPATSGLKNFVKAGSLFGSTPAPAAGSAPTTETPSLFGAPKPAQQKDGGSAPPTTSLFGSKPEEKKDGPATTGVSSAFSLGTKPTEPTSATTSTLAPTSTAVSVQPPSMLKGKTIEEIVNKWSSDLETHVRDFNKFAGEVSVWDRALIENGNNLSAILSHVVSAEREQDEVNQALDSIEQQQRDLMATLDNYEVVAQELAGGAGSVRVTDKGPADMERDKNYMLATDLQVHLDDLSGSLTQMIDSVNSLTLPSEGSSTQDPMAQIAGILSSHLESLQWIDGAVREVEGKVTDVEKKVKESGHGASLSNSRSRGYGLR